MSKVKIELIQTRQYALKFNVRAFLVLIHHIIRDTNVLAKCEIHINLELSNWSSYI